VLPLGRLVQAGVETSRRGLAPAVVCGALGGLLVVVQAALLSRAVDAAFLGGAPLRALAPVLAGLAAGAVARAGLVWLQETLAQRYSARVRLAVRDRLVRRLLALGPRYASGERTGELANALLGGVEALDAYLAQYLPQTALAALVPALVLAAVAWRDPLSAVVLLATFPLVPLFMWLIGSAAEARTRRQWATLSRLAARFHDALSGLATLRAFGRADDEGRVLEQVGERHRHVTMEVLRVALVSALALEALATLGTAVVAVQVGLRLLYARLGFEDALFVLVLAPEFYRPLRALGTAYHAGMAGREAAARLAEIASVEGPLAAPAVETGDAATADVIRASAARAAAAKPPRVRFEAVGFAYGAGQPPALDGFNLELPAGETVALVGPTGAGKSTAASLLLRFLEPGVGRIFVDDVALCGIAPEDWRRHVAWVPQQPRLFHATLRENLLLGRPDAGADAIERAIALAQLTDLARELPRGLDTNLGEGGARLSGGEAQRVALARAFLKDAPVLVLDEPTAQLDLATETAVVEAIRELCRGRTVLLVAHRLTTVVAASRMALVAHGRVIEEGTPAALAASGTVYPRLVAAWQGPW
jgi:ATP-binding cassette subfamily C protein CydD